MNRRARCTPRPPSNILTPLYAVGAENSFRSAYSFSSPGTLQVQLEQPFQDLLIGQIGRAASLNTRSCTASGYSRRQFLVCFSCQALTEHMTQPPNSLFPRAMDAVVFSRHRQVDIGGCAGPPGPTRVVEPGSDDDHAALNRLLTALELGHKERSLSLRKAERINRPG